MKGPALPILCWWLMAQHHEVAFAAFTSRQPFTRSLQSRTDPPQTSQRRGVRSPGPRKTIKTSLNLSPDDQTLAVWVASFASTHIGMSAVRSTIIETLGIAAGSVGLVGNDWRLPGWWPSDNSGLLLFPDGTTVGRQLYRAFYTAVSLFTLGSALAAYLESSRAGRPIQPPDVNGMHNAYLLAASFSFGAAIASLFNASPLGLMPGFEGDEDGGVMLRRDDTMKFAARGLTRITRHPLLLPVVPWGLSTAYLAGGRPCDYVFFGGLSAYTILGCYAQDLRVIREEGSVGTSGFVADDDGGENSRLQSFFEQTSFVPFKAVVDGRQKMDDIIREGPWLQLVAGTLLGFMLEEKILGLIDEWTLN